MTLVAKRICVTETGVVLDYIIFGKSR